MSTTMKVRLSATIAIYLLFTLLFSTLYTNASQVKTENTTKLHIPQNYSTQNHEKRAKILVQKWTVFSRLLNAKHNLSILQKFLLGNKNQNILFVIMNQFLTCKDVLILTKTCKGFQNLLRPNLSNMVTFCNYGDFQHMTETTIIWDDVTFHFLFLCFFSFLNLGEITCKKRCKVYSFIFEHAFFILFLNESPLRTAEQNFD